MGVMRANERDLSTQLTFPAVPSTRPVSFISRADSTTALPNSCSARNSWNFNLTPSLARRRQLVGTALATQAR